MTQTSAYHIYRQRCESDLLKCEFQVLVKLASGSIENVQVPLLHITSEVEQVRVQINFPIFLPFSVMYKLAIHLPQYLPLVP